MFNTLNLRAALIAAVATVLLVASILVDPRNLTNFDPALVTYLFGCIFACFEIVYRDTVWLQRPPTWRYVARGWRLFFHRANHRLRLGTGETFHCPISGSEMHP